MSGALTWDIFCRVVDNYGDAAVCWRLARQLAQEHRQHARLWLDDVATLHALCPEIDPNQSVQQTGGVEVWRWGGEASQAEPPADIVIEAFGCGLPEPLIVAMARRRPPPLWITLEYLSAEAWVAEHHGLPSPHPRYPLERYFFFPGFTAGTGGVLREGDLAARRAMFKAEGRAAFWRSFGFDQPPAGSLVVSLFAYAGAPLAPLLMCWEESSERVIAAVPEGHMAERVREHFGIVGRPSEINVRRGNLEARILPFMPQGRYDELLWSCDVNFVRGEDSFVRAQWAECPFVWHIYPQEENAHRLKLEAFIDLYAQGLVPAATAALTRFWRVWNLMEASPVNVAEAWGGFRQNLATIKRHATVWAGGVAQSGDMATRLVHFARQRVK